MIDITIVPTWLTSSKSDFLKEVQGEIGLTCMKARDSFTRCAHFATRNAKVTVGLQRTSAIEKPCRSSGVLEITEAEIFSHESKWTQVAKSSNADASGISETFWDGTAKEWCLLPTRIYTLFGKRTRWNIETSFLAPKCSASFSWNCTVNMLSVPTEPKQCSRFHDRSKFQK